MLRPHFLLAFAAALIAGRLSAAPAFFVFGADISALATLEADGAQYGLKGQKADAVHLFRLGGFSCFRLRLFVNPNHEDVVTNDLDYTVALAKRVRASGAEFMLDIHYSDTWADPSKQYKPAAWDKKDHAGLTRAVHDYTATVLRRFIAEDAAPHYVQIGNEITNGMLWPDGKVEFGKIEDDASWSRFTDYLRAGIAGLDEAFKDRPRPQVIIHIESTGNVPRTLWLYRNMLSRGVTFDIAGLSYYPEWHGGIADLRATLDAVAAEFKKPVMVVETAYPFFPDEHWQGKRNLTWPLTPAGQLQFLREVTEAVKATRHGLGAGVFCWNPEGIPTRSLRAWVGGSCALFQANGDALPALAFPNSFLRPTPVSPTVSPTQHP